MNYRFSGLLLCVSLCYQLMLTTGSTIDVSYEARRYVGEGEPFSISCIRSAYGAPKWTKDGRPIDSGGDGNSTYNMTLDSLPFNRLLMLLEVETATWNHRGNYKCDSLSSKSHRIEVVPSKETEEEMRKQDRVQLYPGQRLLVQCRDPDDGVFSANWYKDGVRMLESEDDPLFLIEDRILIILKANESDAGDYLCVVEDGWLSFPAADHLGTPIQVTYAAHVEKFPVQIRPILNRKLSLECKVQGYPTPRITWFVDDMDFETFQENETRYGVIENKDGLPNAVFVIEDVDYSDNRVVKCHAENIDGYMETSVQLAVRGTKITTNEKYPGDGVILTPGSDLVLQCNDTDNMLATLHWYKNGLPVNLTDTRLSVEKSNNTLRVVKTVEEDTGNYACVAPDSTNATIVVRTLVKLGPFDNSLNVVQGQSITLVCNVTQGIPHPTLMWYKDEDPLNISNPRITVKTDETRGIEGTELVISDAQFEDRAEYLCIAANEISSANATIMVRVKDKYAALWPFLGICAEVAILCTIIFIYEKKRQKPDFDESETEHNTENKNIPDQEEKSRDVRQRK